MRIKKIHFSHYKTFENFTINLLEFDVLVGPNNAGKSTVLGAFRILSEGLKKANSRKAQLVEGPEGQVWGYVLELEGIPVSLENVFYNYDETKPAKITFYLENGNRLILFFPEKGVIILVPDGAGAVNTPTVFKKHFPVDIRFVPVLGPVEHQEEIYQKEAARRALLTHRASRNFRNIWYHYPEGFEEFREMIRGTWPGMDILPPEMITGTDKPTLAMFCPEDRILREIYWAGFGFQVWCQMLTFILQAKQATMLVIDEPDIYLHSDIQRQLVTLLRELNMQVVIATHSIEIITEVEPESLLAIHKKKTHASRISNTRDLQAVYQLLGSNANPVLTQLAKTRRALFLEGKDFQILSLLARKLGFNAVANRSDFAVIPVEGFNPQKMKDFSKGIEMTLGTRILKAVIFDRDYRSEDEIEFLTNELKPLCEFVSIHHRKELENFLLNPAVIDRAIKVAMRKKFNDKEIESIKVRPSTEMLEELANGYRTEILPKYQQFKRLFVKRADRGLADAPIDTRTIEEFEEEWKTLSGKLRLVPGKDMLSRLNQLLQKDYAFSLTNHLIADSFLREDMDSELLQLFGVIKKFSETEPT